MNKILLIIRREYLSRVKKKSFLLITFLVPLFLIAVYAAAIFLAVKSFESNQATVQVIDQSGLFKGKLHDTENITFIAVSDNVSHARDKVREAKNTFLLIIPEVITETPRVELLSAEIANFNTQETIRSQLENVLRDIAFEKAGIDRETVEGIQPAVTIAAMEMTPEGEKQSSTEAAVGIAMTLSIVVYICLFLYGTQVMRGVIEEKNNRIIEVIISSVKPFQLMMGKIIGIGLVGLTQFILWIALSAALMGGARMMMDGGTLEQVTATQEYVSADSTGLQTSGNELGAYGDVMQALNTVDFQQIIIGFFLYFFGGYMLYSALFAAVGSAVDSETETQQFTFPITVPLLFAYILSFSVLVNDPNGPLAFWLSIIPLTSPIAMLVRIPFGVPTWQLILSFALLAGGFVLTTWIAARIYRIGILMYGKKASYKELVKWFRYKG